MAVEYAEVRQAENYTKAEIMSDGVPNLKAGQWLIATDTNERIYRKTVTAGSPSSDYLVEAAAESYPFDSVKDPTGFSDPLVDVVYDKTTRKVTIQLGGAEGVELLWHGEPVDSMVNGYEVPVANDAVDGDYFLFYNGTDYVWSTSSWEFSQAPICFVHYRENSTLDTFALHESHGCNMPYSVHKMGHEQIGTYVSGDGGDLTGYTLNSTTASNRRPSIGTITLQDEDIPTPLAALTGAQGVYTQMRQTGTGTSVFYAAQNEIVNDGGLPKYNQWTGSAWAQTEMNNNHYQKLFILAIPVSADSNSQPYRFAWVQGQTTSNSLSAIQAITPSDMQWGNLTAAITEFTIIGECIIKAVNNNNWQITEVNKLRVNRANVINVDAAVQSLASVVSVGDRTPNFMYLDKTADEVATEAATDPAVVPNWESIQSGTTDATITNEAGWSGTLTETLTPATRYGKVKGVLTRTAADLDYADVIATGFTSSVDTEICAAINILTGGSRTSGVFRISGGSMVYLGDTITNVTRLDFRHVITTL